MQQRDAFSQLREIALDHLALRAVAAPERFESTERFDDCLMLLLQPFESPVDRVEATEALAKSFLDAGLERRDALLQLA